MKYASLSILRQRSRYSSVYQEYTANWINISFQSSVIAFSIRSPLVHWPYACNPFTCLPRSCEFPTPIPVYGPWACNILYVRLTELQVQDWLLEMLLTTTTRGQVDIWHVVKLVTIWRSMFTTPLQSFHTCNNYHGHATSFIQLYHTFTLLWLFSYNTQW